MEGIWIVSYFMNDNLVFLHNTEVNKREWSLSCITEV